MNLISVSERYGRLFEKVQKDFLTVKRKGKKKKNQKSRLDKVSLVLFLTSGVWNRNSISVR